MMNYGRKQLSGRASIVGATILLATCATPCWGQALEELPMPRSITASPDKSSESPTTSENGGEVVRQRHPDGRVAVERHVALDDDQNYVNHGPYRSFDEMGAKQRVGQYHKGKATGLWTQYYRGHETPVLQESPYNQFKPPFISQASFRDGQLDGTWTIYDSQQQKISEISYVNGERSGPAIWWYANGGKMRELTFHQGMLQGDATFYRSNGQVARRERYEAGHKVQQVVQRYPNRAKQSEGIYRYPQIVMVEEDNWWEMQFGTFETRGEGTKEGLWTLYYPNGQKQMMGTYKRDKAIGQFTWWHETGQRALAGVYNNGVKAGQWTWWHPNGMKMSRGEFRDDNPAGLWASWDAEGGLLQKIDSVHQDGESLVSAEHSAEELPSPTADDGPAFDSSPSSSASPSGDLESLPAPSEFVLEPKYPNAMPSLISAPK